MRRPAHPILLPALGLTVLLPACRPLERSAILDPSTAAPSAPAATWTPPPDGEPHQPPRAEALGTAALVSDPERLHDLPDLIDLAERANPTTRRAWEQAREAAARLGIAAGAYLPTLALAAQAGYSQDVKSTPLGTEVIRGSSLVPGLRLAWLLLDFGRRGAAVERARQELLAANFAFTRQHQDVAFAVQRSFYGYDASRARVRAAEATLASAAALREAAGERLRLGLATVPESLLARQEEARAAYELQEARGAVEDAWAALAQSIGITPTRQLRIADLGAQPLPEALPDTVEGVIDRALDGRPDLAARLAALRAREAEVRRRRADFLPRVGLTGTVGGTLADYRAGYPAAPAPFAAHTDAAPTYGAFLGFEWTLFAGFERENALRESEAQAGVARAELGTLELEVLREVWKAYADVKTALRKYEFAEALLRASEDAYASSRETYGAGVGTFLDLLAAERDLARARYTIIQSRTELLTSAAALAFATGTSPAEPPP